MKREMATLILPMRSVPDLNSRQRIVPEHHRFRLLAGSHPAADDIVGDDAGHREGWA
jgi:hypothetical protein